MNKRTFVGFGFGPIQAGLFLLEAFRTGRFGRLVVSEIDGALVEAVQRNGGRYVVNVAHPDRIEAVTVEGVELLNPTVPADRAALVQAIVQADEMATAVPKVELYDAGGPASIVSLLIDGCSPDRPRIIYAAENHNYAAELLRDAIARRKADFPFAQTALLNTVIGKMSQVVTDGAEMARLGLTPLVPGGPRAVLVEAFNRILISRIRLAGLERGLTVFEEKDDLLPFEEAKLYGHNAIHALAGYLGAAAGYTRMPELRSDERIMALARQAFLAESGAALCRKHARLADPLFTESGFRAYAEDLLERMTNPYLNDAIARVGRDPARKLGYADRLFGAMRLALDYGIEPRCLAAGAAAGLLFWLKERGIAPPDAPSPAEVAAHLATLWQGQPRDGHQPRLVSLTAEAVPGVWAWRKPTTGTPAGPGEALRETPEANAHVHLPPNFSAFDSVEQAVRLAADQGLCVLGTSNYYDYGVYEVFTRHCHRLGVFPLYGLETILMEPALARAGIRTNDPKNPGKMYLCGKGLVHFAEPSPRAQAILQKIREGDTRRMREMIDRLNAHFARHGLAVEVRYEEIVDGLMERHQAPRQAIVLQERHVAMGFQRAIMAQVPAGQRPAALERVFGSPSQAPDDPVRLQEEIRTCLMKAGRPAYVEEAFITFDEAYALVLEMGGIPCYPILADGASPICEFEDPPEKLAAELRRRRVFMVELIPIRNTLAQVERYVRCLRAQGLVATAGTEHNTLDLIPLRPACRQGVPLSAELKRCFWEGVCVAAAHQWLRGHGQPGYVDQRGDLAGPYTDPEERIARLRALGESVIREFCGQRTR